MTRSKNEEKRMVSILKRRSFIGASIAAIGAALSPLALYSKARDIKPDGDYSPIDTSKGIGSGDEEIVVGVKVPKFNTRIVTSPEQGSIPPFGNIDYWTPFHTHVYKVMGEAPWGYEVWTPEDLIQVGVDTEKYCFRVNPRTAALVLVPCIEYNSSVNIDTNVFNNKVAERAFFIGSNSITRKLLLDQWQTVLSTAADRNMVIFDDSNSKGDFTVRLISLLKVVMRRNKGRLSVGPRITDIAIGTDAYFDLFGEHTSSAKVWGITIRPIDGLDIGGELSNYYFDSLKGSIPDTKTNLAVAFDCRSKESFVSCVPRTKILTCSTSTTEDEITFNHDMSAGTVCLEDDKVLLGAF